MKTRLVLLIAAGFVSTAHAEGDPAQGERVFNRCVACHSVEAGQNRVGPSLHGVIDNPSASVEGFNYSPAMREADLVWDDETLHAFLRDPRATVPGTSMAFAGLRDDQQVADLIAFLRQMEDD
jgi:cytochrome c